MNSQQNPDYSSDIFSQIQVPIFATKPQNPFYTLPFDLPLPNHKKPISNIIFLSLAYNFTFIIQTSVRKILHLSSTGQLLHQLEFDDVIFNIFQTDPHNIMVFLRPLKQQARICKIVTIFLEDFVLEEFFFQFLLHAVVEVGYFRDAKLFYTIQKNFKNKKDLRICMFKYPLPQNTCSQSEKLVPHLQANTQLDNPSQQLIKISESGKMAKLDRKITDPRWLHIDILDVREMVPGKREKWRHLEFDFLKAGVCYDINYQTLVVDNLWETAPAVLFVRLHLFSSGDRFKLLPRSVQDIHKYERMYNFDLQYSTPKTKKAWCENKQMPKYQSYLYLPGQSYDIDMIKSEKKYIRLLRQIFKNGFPYDVDYSWVNLGNMKHQQWSILQEWAKQNPRDEEQIQIHYFDASGNNFGKELKTFKRVPNGTIEAQPSHKKQKALCYNSSIFLEYQLMAKQQNSTVQVLVKIPRLLGLDVSTISVFMMVEFVEDCDEDLLFEVVEILEQDQNHISFHLDF